METIDRDQYGATTHWVRTSSSPRFLYYYYYYYYIRRRETPKRFWARRNYSTLFILLHYCALCYILLCVLRICACQTLTKTRVSTLFKNQKLSFRKFILHPEIGKKLWISTRKFNKRSLITYNTLICLSAY